MLLLQSRHLPILCYSPNPNPNRRPPSPSPHPPVLLRFRTSHRQNLQYLKTLGIATSSPSPSPETLDWILSVVAFLKSKGFADADFPRLSFLSPSIFSSSDVDRTLAPVFAFLSADLAASPQESRDLILRCPLILTSSVDYRLRPTLSFLRELGIRNPSAHLINTPVEKLVSKIGFLEDLGLSREDSRGICARFPAIFGYSVENNLRPKVEHLVYEMRRSVEEVKKFPQYFAFSLEKRIVPRHLHLKERGVRVPLKKMLLWSDEKFYAKWK